MVDKPAGILSLRRGEERHWGQDRKDRQATLDELLTKKLPGRSIRPDRDTSRLMLYVVSARVETQLIPLFARHQIERVYLAIALGRLDACTISSTLSATAATASAEAGRACNPRPATPNSDQPCRGRQQRRTSTSPALNRIRFDHPFTAQTMHFSSPLPPDLTRLLERLRKQSRR